MTQKEIENNYAKIIYNDGIIFGDYKNIIIEINAAKTIVSDRKKVCNFVLSPLLVDGSKMKKITKEARDYFASEEGTELLSAAALLTNSNFTSFIANFLLKISFKKSSIPIQVFSDKQDAIKWLKTFNEN